MIILGIDPGLADTGYGLVEEKHGQFFLLDFGTIKTKKNLPETERFLELFGKINEIIKSFQPAALALEKLFFSKNSKSAFLVGRASGVVMLAAGLNNLEVFEYTPAQVKTAVTGWGQADKIQVQKMLKIIFTLKEPFKNDDAADALAIALCHLQNARLKQKIK